MVYTRRGITFGLDFTRRPAMPVIRVAERQNRTCVRSRYRPWWAACVSHQLANYSGLHDWLLLEHLPHFHCAFIKRSATLGKIAATWGISAAAVAQVSSDWPAVRSASGRGDGVNTSVSGTLRGQVVEGSVCSQHSQPFTHRNPYQRLSKHRNASFPRPVR